MLINCRGKAIQAVAGRRINSAREGMAFRPATRSFSVLPEGDPLFATGLLEAGEGVPASSPVLAAGPGADVPFLALLRSLGPVRGPCFRRCFYKFSRQYMRMSSKLCFLHWRFFRASWMFLILFQINIGGNVE